MTEIHLKVQGAAARATVKGVITAGMVGIPVYITTDDAWEGLQKTLVCMSSKGRYSILLGDPVPKVAPEVLAEGMHLYLSLEGRDGAGDIVIPTEYADCGKVKPSPDGVHTGTPTPTEIEQLLRIAQNLILVQEQQPNLEENRLWVPEGEEEEVAFYDEEDFLRLEAAIREMQGGGYVADQQKIAEKINAWLAAHPEATTTVQDGAVTGQKMAAGAVTTDKIQNGAVNADKLAENSVGTGKVQEKAVTPAKLDRAYFETEAPIILKKVIHYGEATPPAGTPGRLFFKKVT